MTCGNAVQHSTADLATGLVELVADAVASRVRCRVTLGHRGD